MKITYDDIIIRVAAEKELPPEIRGSVLRCIRSMRQRIADLAYHELVPESLRGFIKVEVE